MTEDNLNKMTENHTDTNKFQDLQNQIQENANKIQKLERVNKKQIKKHIQDLQYCQYMTDKKYRETSMLNMFLALFNIAFITSVLYQLNNYKHNHTQ
jgi:hypothetical protein